MLLGIAWSPDGQMLASGSEDETVRLWNLTGGKPTRTFKGHRREVVSVCWSPDGRMIAAATNKTVWIWDAASGERLRVLEGHGAVVHSVCWSPDGRTLASASEDMDVLLWNVAKPETPRVLRGHTGGVWDLCWSPNSEKIASASEDKTVRLWDATSGKQVRALIGHGGGVWGVRWSHGGSTIASASGDNTVRLWNEKTGRSINILEGHTDTVYTVSWSHDGQFLASKSDDNTIRIWQSETGDLLSEIEVPHCQGLCDLAFHPSDPILATLSGDEGATSIQVWRLDFNIIVGTAQSSSLDRRQYRNAKVVLLGDTEVGKTALAMALLDREYEATESTHGRKVWTLSSEDVPLGNGHYETREILLWDLAGQPGYRKIHQLQLREVTTALFVFDPHNETDPLASVRYWDCALRQARYAFGERDQPLKKFLVAARCDRFGARLSKEQISEWVREMSFDGFFETSSRDREHWKIDKLQNAVGDSIPWISLPLVSSNTTFQRIKEFLLRQKKTGRLPKVRDLFREFQKQQRQTDLKAATNGLKSEREEDEALFEEFLSSIKQLESRDLVRTLDVEDYVLLQPELFDAYASAVLYAAKNDPNGKGSVAEQTILSGKFELRSEERLTNRKEEKLLLRATIAELLSHELAMPEEIDGESKNLVFPSEVARVRPDKPDLLDHKAVVYSIEGAVSTVYAMLVVRLIRGLNFARFEIWKNAAIYTTKSGGTCGVHLREVGDGSGEMTLFFIGSSDETQVEFEKFVELHLQVRALPNSVKRCRVFRCQSCKADLTERQATGLLERKQTTVRCIACDAADISLVDHKQPFENHHLSVVADANRKADQGRLRDSNKPIMDDRREKGKHDVFLCHNSKDKLAVKEIGEQLCGRQILPWLDEWDLRPGDRWIKELQKVIKRGSIKAAAVFVGPNGSGPWQDEEVEAILIQLKKRKCSVIPVILPGRIGKPRLPPFLDTRHIVDFRDTESDPLEKLIFGITGKRGGLRGDQL
jgi:WD40 repeat protein